MNYKTDCATTIVVTGNTTAITTITLAFKETIGNFSVSFVEDIKSILRSQTKNSAAYVAEAFKGFLMKDWKTKDKDSYSRFFKNIASPRKI